MPSFNLENFDINKITFTLPKIDSNNNYCSLILYDGSDKYLFLDPSFNFYVKNINFITYILKEGQIIKENRHTVSCQLFKDPSIIIKEKLEYKKIQELIYEKGFKFILEHKTDFGFKNNEKEETIRVIYTRNIIMVNI